MKRQNYLGLIILIVFFEMRGIAQNPVHVNVLSGYSFMPDGNVAMTLTGNLTNTGTILSAGSSEISISGTTEQTIGGTGTTQFQNADFNNSSGFQLAGDVSVNGSLSLTSGIINTGTTNTLSLSENSTASRTNGYVNGYFKKSYTTTPQSFTYHLGTENGYSPATLNFSNIGSGSITAIAIESKQPNAPVQSNAINRYWTLTAGGGLTGSYDATFSYRADDFVTLTEGNFESNGLWGEYSSSAWSYPTIGTWTKQGDGGSIQVTGLTNFGDFTGIGCTGLQPEITLPAEGSVQCIGTEKTFSIAVSGQQLAISYQWYKDNYELGITNYELILNNTSEEDIGNYKCVVSNACGSVTSNIYSLTRCCYTVHGN